MQPAACRSEFMAEWGSSRAVPETSGPSSLLWVCSNLTCLMDMGDVEVIALEVAALT